MDLLRDAGPLIFSHLLKAGVELAHLLVRFPQLLFCLTGPARVLNRDGKAERLPRVITDGGNVDTGPEPAPVLPPAPSLLLEAPLGSCPLQHVDSRRMRRRSGEEDRGRRTEQRGQ